MGSIDGMPYPSPRVADVAFRSPLGRLWEGETRGREDVLVGPRDLLPCDRSGVHELEVDPCLASWGGGLSPFPAEEKLQIPVFRAIGEATWGIDLRDDLGAGDGEFVDLQLLPEDPPGRFVRRLAE